MEKPQDGSYIIFLNEAYVTQAHSSLPEKSYVAKPDKYNFFPREGFCRNKSTKEGQAPEGRQQKQEEVQSCRLWNKNHTHRKIDKMKRQRAMYQMKEQDKTPEKQLNEEEIGNLPEKEFRIMIVKMIQDLGKRMEAKIEKMQEMLNKDLEGLKNK